MVYIGLIDLIALIGFVCPDWFGVYKFNKHIPHPTRSWEKGLMSAMKAVDADKDVGAKIPHPFVDLAALQCGGCSMHKFCTSEVHKKSNIVYTTDVA